MRIILVVVFGILSLQIFAQGDKNLAANGTTDVKLIIGIVIVVVVIIAMYLLLRRDDR